MDGLAHALRSYRSGALTKDALFAEIDRLLAGGRASTSWLETLDKENTETPLPPDVHRAVLAKIQTAEAGEPTGDADSSFTQLATSFYSDGGSATEMAGSTLARESMPRGDVFALGTNYSIKGTGDVLNERFVLEERVGTGGMSSVYKALDRRKLEANDRNPYVAVKVLNVEFRARPDSLIALQREAKKSQSLAHPNIVRVYDFDRDGATVYMTMEYLAGEPLAKILRAPKFAGMESREAMRILEAMGSALAFAHDNGIVHADFKPANVILLPNGQVKVIDFGIARAFQRPEDVDQEATRFDPGSLGALTPTYASPEMLEHREPDPRDDIYALACIAYEMLTGRHPFGRMQATEARDGGLTLEHRPKLTRRQYRALKSALAFDRQKRTPSVRQFLSEMRGESQVAVPVPLYQVVRAVAALLIAGTAFYYLTSTSLWHRATNSINTGMRNVGMDTAPAEESVDNRMVPVEDGRTEVGSTDAGSAETAVMTSEPNDVTLNQPAAPPAAAIQSVERAKPVTAADVNAVLEKIPCAAMTASVENGAISVRGFLSAKREIRGLEQDLRAMPGVRSVRSDVAAVGDSHCAIVDMYRPFWLANRSADKAASIASRGGATLAEGQPLVVQIGTPAYPSYVHVDYYALDGSVVHLLPSARASGNQAPANYRATLGDLGEWRISAPFGREMVVLLVTPRPLFAALRPDAEANVDYLSAIKKQLDTMAKESGDKAVVADFVMIETQAKKSGDGKRR